MFKSHLSRISHKWKVGSRLASTFPVFNPSTGEKIKDVKFFTTQETEKAIEKAQKGFEKWREVPLDERSNVLKKLYHLMLKEQKSLSELITRENGKTLKDAQAEVMYSASYVEWFAEEAKRVYGEFIPSPLPHKRILVVKQPVGVCGFITPWNFPLGMLSRKVAPALAVGCSVVTKPAEDTPLSAIKFAELAIEAGVPEESFQVVTCPLEGAVEVGKVLVTHPLVKKISFTGSTQVGKILMELASGTIKRVSLELGGNAPFIVFESADLDKAVDGLVASKLRCSGQTCISPNRIYVHEKIHDKFVEKLKGHVTQMKCGDGFDKSSTQGPLINKKAVDNVKRKFDDAVNKGAKVICGGKVTGNFFTPAILTEVAEDALCTEEETFGPLIPIYKFSSEEDVVSRANNTVFGLAGYFFSENFSQIWRVAEKMEVGMVGVNDAVISSAMIPFGGIKESGMGREGSKYGIYDFLNIKLLSMEVI